MCRASSKTKHQTVILEKEECFRRKSYHTFGEKEMRVQHKYVGINCTDIYKR